MPYVIDNMGRSVRLLRHGGNTGDMASNHKTKNLDRQIDENLRRVYTDAAGEPVPDRFTKLLDQLRERDSETKPQKGQS
jgi:hypothetical protein